MGKIEDKRRKGQQRMRWLDSISNPMEMNLSKLQQIVDVPGSSAGKESACNAGDLSLIPELGWSPGEGIGCPLQYSWASLVAQMVKKLPAIMRHGFDPWVRKIPLEKGMATHSSRIAWRISWTEEPGGLQSMGSQRVGHDWATFTLSLVPCVPGRMPAWMTSEWMNRRPKNKMKNLQNCWSWKATFRKLRSKPHNWIMTLFDTLSYWSKRKFIHRAFQIQTK